jgi:hypothetical protein
VRNAEEAMARGSMSGVRDIMKELPINLERFKESLGLIVGRSIDTDMQYGHGHTAWVWTCIMDTNLQHSHRM